jgi:hypothetical protein
MPRATPPIPISYTEVAYATSASTINSASVSWLTGDVIVVIVLDELTATIGLPTATGLTFVQQQASAAAGACAVKSAGVIAPSGGSSAVSATISTGDAGMGVWVWRGSDGLGNSTEQHTTAKTKSLTPVDTHSAYCWSVGDFNADNATGVLLPTPTTTQEAAQVAAHYTVYSGNLNDEATGAATLFGISGVMSTGPYTICVQEVLGTGGVVGPLQYTGVRLRYRA